MLKFKLGPPPDNTAMFEEHTWKSLSAHDTTGTGALRTLAVSVACAIVCAGLWKSLVPGSLPIGWPSIALIIAIAVSLVVVHETLHLLAFPGGGVSHAVIGFWPARGAAYVLYTLPTKRGRFVLATLAPVLAITVGLLVAAAAGVRVPAVLQWASVVNAFASGADLLVVYSLLRQSVPSALVLESGQQLYVRVP